MLLLVLVTLQGWKQPSMSYLSKDVFLAWEGQALLLSWLIWKNYTEQVAQ